MVVIRQAAWEAAEVVPGSEATLQQLQDPIRRSPRPRETIPEYLLEHNPRDQDEEKFFHNLRSVHRGVACGFGLTSEHVMILLENVRDGYCSF